MIAEFRLERSGEPDLTFAGERLAEATSRINQDQARWSELVAYKTESGKWILEILGKSAVPGETTRKTALTGRTPEEFVQFLYKPTDEGGYKLSYPAKVLLKQLVAQFPEIKCFDQTERI